MVTPVKIPDIKAAPWLASDPKLWFANLELNLRLEGVTDKEVKCLILIRALPPEITSKIKDVAYKDEYVDTDYNNIKEAVLALSKETFHDKWKQLTSLKSLGDQKPSERYKEIARLATDVGGITFPTSHIFALWLPQLPPSIRVVVKSMEEKWDPATDLAKVDALLQVADDASHGSHVHSVNTRREHPRSRSTSRSPSRSPSRSSSPRRARSSSKKRSGSPSRSKPKYKNRKNPRDYPRGHKYCFYHWMFGSEAQKCEPEHCSFKKEKGNDDQ